MIWNLQLLFLSFIYCKRDNPLMIKRLEHIEKGEESLYGGKAVRLALVEKNGILVPKAYALSGELFQALVYKTISLDERIPYIIKRRDKSKLHQDSFAEVRAKIKRIEFPQHIIRSLFKVFNELRRPLIVRSSSTIEDRFNFSAAGMQDSISGITEEEELINSIKQIWASLWTPRVISYLQRIGYNGGDPLMGIIIQEMVKPKVAGVLFTKNPVTEEEEYIINVVEGGGEKLSAGKVIPENIIIEKGSLKIKERVGGEDGFILDDSYLKELICTASTVESIFQKPQDIEWVIDEREELYIVQTRDITTKKGTIRSEPYHPAFQVWSNLNVGEALAGVATPLTWSVALKFSELGFKEAFGSLGCTIPDNAQFVGNFYGRIYLNLTQIMLVIRQIPFIKVKYLMELGGGITLEEAKRLLEQLEQPYGSIKFWVRLPLVLTQLLKDFLFIDKEVTTYENSFQDFRLKMKLIELDSLSPEQLFKSFKELERWLNTIGLLMLKVSTQAILFYLLLRQFLYFSLNEKDEHIITELIGGIEELESAAPGIALWHIAQEILQDKRCVEFFLRTDPKKINLNNIPSYRIRHELEQFFKAYGYRCVKEGEIASPRWEEEPWTIYLLLKKNLEAIKDSPIKSIETRINKRNHIMKELKGSFSGVKWSLFSNIYELFVKYTRYRERMRARVTELLYYYRLFVFAVARKYSIPENDIFMLSIDEIIELLKNRSKRRNLDEIIKIRKQQYLRDISLPDPPDIFIGTPDIKYLKEASKFSSKILHGIGVSSGRIEGKARVLSSIEEMEKVEKGEILILPSADVGWTPIFIIAGGVIMEKGGMLSHASIVIREFGIPSIVNVPHITKIVKTGQKLIMDGSTGEIIIIS